METMLEGFKIYLFETGRVTSDMTIQSYSSNVKQLLKWVDKKDIAIKSLDRMIMLKYLEFLRSKGYKANTYNTKINSISNFNNYLKDKDIIEKNIIFGKDKIQLAINKEIETYSDDEMKLIEAYSESLSISQRDSLIIKILSELGLRVTELTNLQLVDIDVVGLEVEVQGKNNKRRMLPIRSDLAERIRKYISGERKASNYSNSKYLLLSERSGKMHRNTVLDIVKRMGRELNIDAYNHKFRHTIATRMSNKDIPIQVIQKFLGHSEIQTTIEFYVNVDKKQLQQAIENI